MKRKVRVKALEGTPFFISEQEEIGKGSFGRVVRAYKKDQPFRQLVAKIIQVIPENKNSIVAQIKILKQIPHHQNLVNCQKLQIVTQNNFYLIMEYCNGGSFQNYIKNNHNCSEEIIWRFFKEFAKGYHVLYDCHLIHRDIKPQNILIHNGKFKIADFGLSRKVNHHNLTQNLSVKGTPLYIAPQLQKQSAGSSKIDVFSLGIVMYRLAFNGKHPFHNQQNTYLSLQQYFTDMMATSLKIPKFPKRSVQLTDLIEQMLEKDPIKRIGWKQIFEHPKLKQKAEVVNSESNEQFSQLMKSIVQINRSSASLQVIAEPFNHRDQMGAQIERLVEFTEYLPHFQIRGLEIFIIRSKVIIQLIKHLNGNLKAIKEQKKMKKIGIIQQIINEGLIFIQNSLGKLIQIVSKYQTQVQNSSTSKLIQTLQSQRQNMRQMIQKLKLNQKYEHLKYENLLYDYLTEYTEWKSNMKQKFKIPTALMIDLYDGLLKLQSMVIFNANGRIEVVQIQLQDAELDKINYQNLGTYQLYLDQINQITMNKVENRLKIIIMQNKDYSAAGQLKKLVTGLDSNRKNIQGKSDVSGNITQAKETFNQFEGVIKGQTSAINSLKAFQKSMSSQNARNLEVKRFFFSFAQKMKAQISKFLKIGQNVFTMSAQKNNKQEDYEKIVAQLLKLITSIKQQSENPQKMYAGVYKLLAIRDNIICQVFRVMLYKKNILWRDLNIKFDDYIHGEVKNALLKIKQNEQKYGYVPTSLHFRMPKNQTQGQSSLQDLITIVFQDHGQLIESMKNFSKLSQEPQLIQDISKNQHIVKGLRQKIQVLTRNYNTLMEKYRGLQISKGKAQMGQNQQKSLNEKIEDLESSIIKKDQEIIELKQGAIKSDTTIQGLKDKNKELEDQISKWQNFQLPKIKELELGQKTLLEQFTKTKKDFETYSGLYQSQREDKIKAYSDLKDERSKLNQMANILGRERRKIKQLKAELLRKDQIIMQLVEKAPDP